MMSGHCVKTKSWLAGPVSLALALSLVGVAACKPKTGATTKAIFSGGKGYALIPARRFFATRGSGPEFENSIRMMMLPVKCGSEREIVTLENFALASQDGVRYYGGSILDPDGKAIPGTSSCAVLGYYALHLWATQYLFPGNPKNDEEYHRQQWVYLALRGPYNTRSQGTKAPAVEKFFSEAGAVRMKGGGFWLGLWDGFFNPCLTSIDSAKPKGFDKQRHFKCEGGNYRAVAGNPDDATLVMAVANASESLMHRMARGEFAPLDTTGIATAIRLSGSVGDSFNKAAKVLQGKNKAKGFLRPGYQRGQPVRNIGRFLRFGPGGGRQLSSYSPTYAGYENQNPAPVQYYVPQTITPPPQPQPPVVPQPWRTNPGSMDPDRDAFDQKVQEWKQSEGFYSENFFGSQPQSFREVEAYAERSGRPISDILGPELYRQYENYQLSQLADNAEPPAPAQNIDDSGITERLLSEGYEVSSVYNGWMTRSGVNTPYGMSTFYAHPDGRREECVTSNGQVTWYSLTDEGKRQGDPLVQYDANGRRVGGSSAYNAESGAWQPYTPGSEPLAVPPEQPVEVPEWSEADFWQNNG